MDLSAMSSAMVSLESITSTFDEAFVIITVFLVIFILQNCHNHRHEGTNGRETKRCSKSAMAKMEKMQRPAPKSEEIQSMTQLRANPAKEQSAPMFEMTSTSKDFSDNLGSKPFEGSLTDASTVDSSASGVDSDSESDDVDYRTLTPIGETQSNFDRERLRGGSFQDYLALHEINKRDMRDQRAMPEKKPWTQTNSLNANLSALMLLSEVWKSKSSPPSELARQLHKMLSSNNIALSPETYQMLVRIAVDGGCLPLATELSFEMERLTGAKLPQAMHDRMLEMHLMPDICAMESLSLTEELETIQEEGESIEEEEVMPDMCVIENLPGRAGTLKGEMIANLTKHPWSCHPSNDPSLQQKHQIYVGNQNKVYCLSMMGDTSPKLKQYELIWNGTTFIRGKGVKSPEKGVKSAITLNSTCADIKDGVVVWTKDDSTGHSWQWHASQ
eukprot:gnl/MRDRNA2_/MRDRNA2_83857_c1_seq11.p1 gnl/MRDRNA2_/MRDRNA2_83857_c1~~gnl/MRDRNA2_/MRDRNA2_83857_c1_seq11.p1  ORF type:complete len:444 (+),score=102.69 gnl/MRDRNA2_/MRDRNA2_83857_c1_seq11:93-1424(+)